MEEKENKLYHDLLERREEAKTVRKVVMTVSLLIIGTILAGAVAIYFFINSAMKPVDPKSTKTIDVEIPIGTTVDGMAAILKENNVIKSEKVFRYYIKFKNESGFQASTYALSKSMDMKEIIEKLKTGLVSQKPLFRITIPEGKTLDQIAFILSEKTNLKKDEILKTINSKEFIEKMQAEFPSLITDEVFHSTVKYPLEGYLYPATYDFFKEEITVEEAIRPMLQRGKEVITEVREEYEAKTGKVFEEAEFAPGQTFTVHKLLTLASLIEEEATAMTDREKISSVFYNRMELGMPLQTDPTVLYALGEHKDRVLYKDLEVDSPYNTYKVKGLTPGPIAGAGVDSIKAALYPAKTDYVYFLADSTGKVHFSKTLEEHNQLKAQYISNQ